MNQSNTADGTVARRDVPAPGLLARVLGVIVSPGETFRQVVEHPRPVSMLLFVAVVSAVAAWLFFSTETGRLAWLDTAVGQQESMGRVVTDQQYAVMERISGFLQYIAPLNALVLGPILALIVAGVLKGAFAVLSGGDATFRQVLDVVATSSVIVLLRTLFVLPINYAQESMSGVTNFSAFVPMLAEDTFLVRFLRVIDLFGLWWVAVLAIGLAVLYRGSARSIATTLYALYAIIAVAVASVLTLVGGS